MRRFLLLCALLSGLGLLVYSPQGQSASATPPADETHKIVYLSERGPVLIALRLHIDGKPIRAAHRAFIDKVFDYLDRDGDGTLSSTEAGVAPTVTALTTQLLPFGRRGGTSQRVRLPRDSKVSRADLVAAYSRSGLPAFKISEPEVQAARFRLVQPGSETTPEQLTDRLFHLLDTDKDGKLSAAELKAAPAILGKLDVDEDEMLSTTEMMGEAGGSDYGVVLVFANARPEAPSHPLRVVAEGGTDEELARALVQRYGKSGDSSLPVADLGIARAAAAALDKDGDGMLSLEELTAFGKTPAHATLTVHLGNRDQKPVMALETGKPLPKGLRLEVTREGATLQVSNTRITLAPAAGPGRRALPPNVRVQFKTLFQRADMNNRGYLTKQDAVRGSIFRDVFDAMDRDGDGKLTEKEMLAYLDQMELLGRLAERSCVSVTVSTEGQGLFGLLDTNGDGRLSVRELRNAHKVLDRLGVGNGKLTKADVPRTYRAGLTLGPNGGVNPGGRPVGFVKRMDRRGERIAVSGQGPLWFRKMDRNRDGDVSRKEFLGTDEQFKAIDTDGDGLISAEEAEAYEKRRRSTEE
jgi:Ca2+-binding EF-hand superfamily protein